MIGLAVWPLLLLGMLLVAAAFLVAPFAIWPAIAPWWWNRKQRT